LRSLFVMRVSALEYQLRLPGFEVSEDALEAQKLVDECAGGVLETLANEIETGKPRNAALAECFSSCRPEMFNPSHFALLRAMNVLITSLAAFVDNEVLPAAAMLK
jgi:hypothetical protein